MKFNDRTGEKKINNQGMLMLLLNYRGAKDIDVLFQDGYLSKSASYKDFAKGSIRNPNIKSFYGVGRIGEGKYAIGSNGEITLPAKYWLSMLKRCYYEESLKNNPAYAGCTVCEEWLNYQNFAKWFNENYYIIPNEKMQLDKDILSRGNKVYCPEKCSFVPQRINALFCNAKKIRGAYPVGVCYVGRYKNKYMAQCCDGTGANRFIGRYGTQSEAFRAYKLAKESLISKEADYYRPYLPPEVYDAIISYEVLEND